VKGRKKEKEKNEGRTLPMKGHEYNVTNEEEYNEK
jgi:hypothetical protein